jgi:hypothetical protein
MRLWKGETTLIGALTNLCAAWQACIAEGIDPLSDDWPRVEKDAGLAAYGDSDV